MRFLIEGELKMKCAWIYGADQLMIDASLSGENERINELIEFIRKNKFRTLEYDDKLVRKIIQNVTVYEDHFVISFKSGIEMEICKCCDI